MVENVLASMPDLVHSVKSDNATDFFAGDYPKALLFSDKEATSPLFKSLAIQFKGRMRMGKASLTDTELAKKFDVDGSSKLVVVKGTDASKFETHAGKLKKDELVTFIDTHALKERKGDPLLAAKKPKIVKALTAEDLATKVLADKKHVWGIFFHKGANVPDSVESLAGSYKAFQWGTFDCSKNTAACKEQTVEGKELLRVYGQDDKSEYEDFKGAPTCEEDCMQLEAMSDFVGEHMPNIVVAGTQFTCFTGTKVQILTHLSGQSANQPGTTSWHPQVLRFLAFLLQKYKCSYLLYSYKSTNTDAAAAAERPRVILMSKKAEPTPLYKSLALKFKGVLTFGLYANPSANAMAQLQVTPALLVPV
jgi:hypothetical protein